MDKILISACFLGANVRYNGIIKPLQNEQIAAWRKEGRLISVCPEVSGGLSTPREPAEIQPSELIIDTKGQDVTLAFYQGAQHALFLCQKHHIKYALLKEFSPSCGSSFIYDGSFSQNKIEGEGVTAKLLRQNNIKVFSELTLEQLISIFR